MNSLALVNYSSNTRFCHSMAVNLAPETEAPLPPEDLSFKLIPGLPWHGQAGPCETCGMKQQSRKHTFCGSPGSQEKGDRKKESGLHAPNLHIRELASSTGIEYQALY